MFNTANSIKTEEDVDMSSKILDLSIRSDSINPIETSPRSNEYRKRSQSITPIGYKNRINSSRSYTDPYPSLPSTKYAVENSPSPYNREYLDNQSSYMSPQNVATAPTLHGYSPDSQYVPMIYGPDGKTRPFKAYRTDSFSMATNPDYDADYYETFEEFKARIQKSIPGDNGRRTNPNMRRNYSQSNSRTQTSDNTNNASGNGNNSDSSNIQFVTDETYYEKRKKNNEAAKRSRDRRIDYEDDLALYVFYLENQNMHLLVNLNKKNALVAELEAELFARRH